MSTLHITLEQPPVAPRGPLASAFGRVLCELIEMERRFLDGVRCLLREYARALAPLAPAFVAALAGRLPPIATASE